MGKNQAASGLTNIIQYDNRGNITFVSGSTTLMSVSSSGAITTTGTISGSNAANALLLNGTGSLAFTTTASYNVASASLSSRTTQVERTYATTGSNTFTGAQFVSDTSNAISFTSTASLYSNGGLRVQGNSFVSGTAYFNNIVVYGTSSIQYITSSQVNVGTNIITVNTDTPSVRFGGLAVFDSGSTGLTGSMLWDSEKNHFVYSNPSGSSYSGGMLISGPRSSALGSEQGTTACMLLVGQGGDHLTSSMIYHSSTVTCIPGIINGGSDIILCGTNGNVYGGTIAGSGTISNSNGSSYARFFGASHATTPNTTAFVNANSTSVTINSSGNVGIGISPVDKLHVNGNIISEGCFFSGAPDNLRIFAGHWATVSGNANCYLVFQAGGGNASFGTPQGWGGSAAIYTCGQNRLTIITNGNVGIGCSTPNKRLTVNGDIGMSNTYNWGVINDNDPNWGFKVCTSGANYSTFISYAGDAGSDRRGGIYNQNGHWVAYGNCVGNFIITCNLSTSGNINAGGGITAGGSLNGTLLTSTTQRLGNSTGNFANMVHKVYGAAGAFSCLVICVNLSGAGGWGYIINTGGTGLGQFQSGGGYINSPGNFSHGVAVGSGFIVTCHTCAGTNDLIRFMSSGGVHPFASIQMFGSLSQFINDDSIYMCYF